MIINFISGPRNISTALMYSFAQRSDTKVVDEPFYAYYLIKTGVDHPGREDSIAAMESNPNRILSDIHSHEKKHDVLFIKNMAHHHEGLDWGYLTEMKNVFLVRDPHQLIASFAQVIPNPTMQDIGLKLEAEVFEFALKTSQHEPIIVDSNDILKDPEMALSRICEVIGIPFEKSMLSWEKGPRPEDGPWAKYWYKNVHNSTGFAKQNTSTRPLPDHCRPLYEKAITYYSKLIAHPKFLKLN